MNLESIVYDVVVVGAGNAALCAALSARDHGASVLMVEKAARYEQGGNCPFTGGGFRFVHNGMEDVRVFTDNIDTCDTRIGEMTAYTSDNYRDHLLTVTEGDTDRDLMEILISHSRPTMRWMLSKGVKWELPSSARGNPGVPSAIPNSVGLVAYQSGPGLVGMLTTAARRAGVVILYETVMKELIQRRDRSISGVRLTDCDGTHEIEAKAVVLACGGFEANPEMRSKYLGPAWRNAKVRGSRHNTGDGHRAALAAGASLYGQLNGCHATPVDLDSPSFGNLNLTDRMPRRSYPLGITVNKHGNRFMDEGCSFPEQTFVKVARDILEQDDGIAYQIFDKKAIRHLEPRYGAATSVEALDIKSLASRLGIHPHCLDRTVSEFNLHANDGEYEPERLDGKSTRGLGLPKTNWAIKLDTPPFVAFTVTGGITYTYGGLRINSSGQVLGVDDSPITGLYAAGEIVGGIFHHGSLRAAGLMHGAVFGKISGGHAATQ